MLENYFSSSEKDVYSLVNWSKRACGEENTFWLDDAEMPTHWSDNACNIVVGKYFRREGVKGSSCEKSLKQLIDRVVDSVANAGISFGYFDKKVAEVFSNELKAMILLQKASWNSPVWFNVGLFQKYGIESSGESYFYNSKESCVEKCANIYEHPQGSACFIQSVEDNIDSFYELMHKEGKIFKLGSGSGSNFSAIRSKESKVSGGGKASGLIAFLDVFDRAAGAIRSGGVTRRAAKMVCVDVEHPEIGDFIGWKAKEEKKAEVLAAAGYSTGIDGEVLRSLSGQNANHSIRVSDEFMKAVEAGSEKEKKIFSQMCEAAWACGDPGIQFDDTINSWNPCANEMKIKASNPCSEYMFVDDSACNLASINLLEFYDSDSEMDWKALEQAVSVLILAQDILVDFCGYPSREIAENSHRFRPLGLGYTNFGTLLMCMGLAYDSSEARWVCAEVSAFIMGKSLEASIELAEKKDVFAGFEKNKSSLLDVIGLHAEAALGLKSDVLGFWKEIPRRIEKSGLRNAQLTAIAPTGTISFMMDCDTTGIEPEFSRVKKKSFVGGEEKQLLNQSVSKALMNLGYEGADVADLAEQISSGVRLKNIAKLKEEHLAIFHTAVSVFAEEVISVEAHVGMMAAAQPFISGAISKTVNLPEEYTAADIEKTYLSAWKRGLKSVAVYRNNSKSAQPLKPMECFEC